MAKYGLLQGLGRGLSQGSQMLAQGMSEDREVERQRMREASIEKRWQRQEQKDDARYADNKAFQEQQMKRQEAQDAKADSRYANSQKLDERQMSLAEQQAADRKEMAQKERIEQTLGRLEKEAEREGAAIDRRFDRQIDIAKANGANADEIKKLHTERDAALQGVNAKLTAKMLPALKSFGNELQGTAYASYYDQILAEKENETERQGQQFLTDAGVVGADGNFTNSASPKGSGRASFVGSARGSVQPTENAQSPLAAKVVEPGFIGGLQSALAGNVNPVSIDESAMSPAQLVTTRTGQFIGNYPGKLYDGLEQVGGAAKPAWDYINTPRAGGGLLQRAGQYKKQ